jgi:hypothetical protein
MPLPSTTTFASLPRYSRHRLRREIGHAGEAHAA